MINLRALKNQTMRRIGARIIEFQISRFAVALIFGIFFSSGTLQAQSFGENHSAEELRNDLRILHEALDKFHTGMYWYTPKDSVDQAFEKANELITNNLSTLEFFRIMAPLVALSREDHTDIILPRSLKSEIREKGKFFPFTVVYLNKRLFVLKNGSQNDSLTPGTEFTHINDEPVDLLGLKLGSLFASDGYIKRVKYSDLRGFSFARHYLYTYGNVDSFKLQTSIGKTFDISPLSIEEINANIKSRKTSGNSGQKESLEFRILDGSMAYLGIHDFSNDSYKENKLNRNYKRFLKESFSAIEEYEIKTLVIDVSKNGGGTEGNENLLYSYIGENYQKYKKVRAKTQKARIDDGNGGMIKLKTFGWFEKTFANTKLPDGSYERKLNGGPGLMAYKKEPKFKFEGKLYVIISPITYSGGSEFSNMVYTNGLATFVGEETGGGFYGNTSGYTQRLVLPASGITVKIPALQFVMNVSGLPFGSGVIPHHQVIPTFEEYAAGENAPLKYIIEMESREE